MTFSGKKMSTFISEISQETVQAYHETEFRVFAKNSLTLKISIKSEALLALYKDNRSESCAFVTACNPFGELLSDEENSSLQKQLDEEIKFRGLNSIPGEGNHPIGDWPDSCRLLLGHLQRCTLCSDGIH